MASDQGSTRPDPLYTKNRATAETLNGVQRVETVPIWPEAHAEPGLENFLRVVPARQLDILDVIC